MRKLIVILFFAGALSSFSAHGEDADKPLDDRSQRALLQTQLLLSDPAQRNKAIKEDKTGHSKMADDALQALTGSGEVSSEVYQLAAEVFAKIVQDTNGDVTKMKQAIEKFQKDPEAFANSWSADEKAKLHEITEKIRGPATDKH